MQLLPMSSFFAVFGQAARIQASPSLPSAYAVIR